MKIRTYGKLADLLGAERELETGGPCTVGELRALLASQCPEAAESLASQRVLACVDDTVVTESHLIRPGEAVEFLAPVSGG